MFINSRKKCKQVFSFFLFVNKSEFKKPLSVFCFQIVTIGAEKSACVLVVALATNFIDGRELEFAVLRSGRGKRRE